MSGDDQKPPGEDRKEGTSEKYPAKKASESDYQVTRQSPVKSVWNNWKEMDSRALPSRAPEPVAALQESFRKRLEHVLGISEPESQLHSIQREWSALAGLLGNHSEPIEIKDGRLVVVVRQSVYAQELQLHSRSILKAIEKTLGFRLQGIQIRSSGFRK